MRRIQIPDFRTIEEAIRFAEVNKPFETAMAAFQNRDAYSQYGERATAAAVQCWEAANKGDKATLSIHMRALSKALPDSLFGYVEKRR